jgi:hypothetical protein
MDLDSTESSLSFWTRPKAGVPRRNGGLSLGNHSSPKQCDILRPIRELWDARVKIRPIGSSTSWYGGRVDVSIVRCRDHHCSWHDNTSFGIHDGQQHSNALSSTAIPVKNCVEIVEWPVNYS